MAAAVPLVHSSTAGNSVDTETERDERRDPLVVDDVDGEIGALGECERHRRGTRTGSDHGMGDAEADPLVDQRGAERRLHVLRPRSLGRC